MSQTKLVHANPGDRITADFINSIIDEVNLLQELIDALPVIVGNAPLITDLQPSDQVKVGAELDVIGRNFGVPATQNVVTLDGTPVTGFLPGCTDTVLKLAVPEIAGLPKLAQLSIQTSAGAATHPVFVALPAPGIEGRPSIRNTSGSLGTITAGGTFTFSFLIDASTVSVRESYQITLSFANPTPAAVPASAWVAATTLIGTSGDEVSVDPHTPVTVGVRITIPAGATGADLTVGARSLHNDPDSTAVPIAVPIRVGQAPPQTDPRIHTPSIGQIGQAAPFHVAADGALEVKYASGATGTAAQVPIDLGFDVAGTYHYDVSIENADTTLWTVGAVTPNDLQMPAGSTPQVHFPLTLLATGPRSESRFVDFVVTRTDADSIGQISNFLRFQIRGFSS